MIHDAAKEMTLSGNSFSYCLRMIVSLFAVLIILSDVCAFAQEQIVCIQCHSNLQGKLNDPVKLWKESIHAENGIACNNCHGGDPKDIANAMSVERGFLGAPKEIQIPSFCGRCHVGVMNDYLKSAHGKALGKGGPTCVTCHGNHHVLKASLEIINEKTCSRCHSYERARLIKEAMLSTDRRMIAIEYKIRDFKGRGVDTEKFEKGLFASRNHFHALFHNVDVELVKSESSHIHADLDKLEARLQKLSESFAKRKVAGTVVVGLALLAALLFHLLKKTYDK